MLIAATHSLNQYLLIIHEASWHSPEQFPRKCYRNLSLMWVWKLLIEDYSHTCQGQWVNTLRPRQNGRRFSDDTFKRIFLNENVKISIKISLKFVSKGPMKNIPTLVQIMAWRRSGDKPLSEPMMVSLLTHICVTRPQWVNAWWALYSSLLILVSHPWSLHASWPSRQ